MAHNKKNWKYGLWLIVAIFFFFETPAHAQVLNPALPVTTCGEIADVGTYTLSGNISTSTGPCLVVSSGGGFDETIINGAGFTITGGINGDGINPGDPGHNFTVQNARVVDTISASGMIDDGSCSVGGGNGGTIILDHASTTALVASGGNDASGCFGAGSGGSLTLTYATSTTIISNGGSNVNNNPGGIQAGTGGTISIASSSFSSINSDGGYNTVNANGGNGGSVSVLNGILNLSNTTISTVGGLGDTGNSFSNGADGTSALTFTSLVTNINTYLYSTHLILNSFLEGLINGVFNPIPPGQTIDSALKCALINLPGTYHLTQDITGECGVTGNNIIIDGAGYTIDGNVSVVGATPNNPSFNFSLQNISVTGTTTSNGGNITIASSTVHAVVTDAVASLSSGNAGAITVTNSTTTRISANGTTYGIHCGLCTYTSGSGGVISITNSVTGSISANSAAGAVGSGGIITISAQNLALSSTTISATGSTNGTLTLNYSTLATLNLTLSALANLILNGPGNSPGSLGAFGGGAFLSNNIITDGSQCNLGFSGTYVLENSITGNCHITNNNVTIDGQGLYTINGNVTGDAIVAGNDGFNFTLKNIIVTGTITSNGSPFSSSLLSNVHNGSGGAISIINATTSDIYSNETDCNIFKPCGSGGSVTITNSNVGNVIMSGKVSHYVDVGTGGQGGVIIVASSTTGSLIANGGDGDSQGGQGGTVTINYSRERVAGSAISANGGNAMTCGYGGSGGTIVASSSTYTGSRSVTPGVDNFTGCRNNHVPSGSPGSSGSSVINGQSNSLVVTPTSPVVAPSVNTNPSAAPSSASVGISSGSFSEAISSMSSSSAAVSPISVEKQNTIGTAVTAVIQKVADTAVVVANSPAGKTVQAAGLFGGILASVAAFSETAFATPLVASESLLIPARLWGLILVGLGIRRRARRWGTVYDSVTKQPIDPAFVTVKDESGKVVAESITDIDGRYGFLLPNGTYYISAKKTNYEFPSIKLAGKSSDELYNNLYFGERVVVREGEILDKDIPMDQKNFDWNEFTKMSRKDLLFHSRHEKPWAIASNYIYGIGLVISVITAAVHPHWYNIVILVLYVFVLLPLEFRVKRKKLGHVVDKTTHQPLSYAIIRVTAYDHETPLRSGVSDANGRYYCIVPKGKCFVDIEKKNADGSYTKIYSSSMITNKSGIINSNFAI